MFAKTIIDSDAFLDMPISARLLYYDLTMRADDDGFVNSPKKIIKFVGASTDDMNILIARQFVIPFESGVVVIRHWKIHNYIRKDTYKETPYKEEKSMLCTDENNSYIFENKYPSTNRQRAVDEPLTQVRLGKDSIGKDSIELENKPKRKRFVPPTFEEVKEYCQERNNNVDAVRFIDYYTSNGWQVGRNKMKDWKAAVRTWEKQDFGKQAETKDTIKYGGTYV